MDEILEKMEIPSFETLEEIHGSENSFPFLKDEETIIDVVKRILGYASYEEYFEKEVVEKGNGKVDDRIMDNFYQRNPEYPHGNSPSVLIESYKRYIENLVLPEINLDQIKIFIKEKKYNSEKVHQAVAKVIEEEITSGREINRISDINMNINAENLELIKELLDAIEVLKQGSEYQRARDLERDFIKAAGGNKLLQKAAQLRLEFGVIEAEGEGIIFEIAKQTGHEIPQIIRLCVDFEEGKKTMDEILEEIDTDKNREWIKEKFQEMQKMVCEKNMKFWESQRLLFPVFQQLLTKYSYSELMGSCNKMEPAIVISP